MAILPARKARPRDKAKAEQGVLLVERWILARLRDRQFFSLAELNAEIARLLEQLNDRPLKKLPGSRRSLYESLDRPAMRPLPARPYEFAEWKKARVHIDYHVEIDRHYYSVPYQLVKQQLDARFTANTVELFHKGRRVASHRRAYRRGHHTTVAQHMPSGHRAYAECRSGWCAGRRKAVPRPPNSSDTSSPRGFIPSMASAAVWASCDSANGTAMGAWRPPAAAPWPLARTPTKASNRS